MHLHRKLNKKKKVGLSTQHSKVDLIFHSPVPLIEEFYFILFFSSLLVNEVGMCVNDRVPYLA